MLCGFPRVPGYRAVVLNLQSMSRAVERSNSTGLSTVFVMIGGEVLVRWLYRVDT